MRLQLVMCGVIVCGVVGLVPAVASAEEQIPLWANGAPGFEDRKDVAEVAEQYYIRNVHNPSITVFLPPADKANGAAIVICPGGGQRILTYKDEGKPPAEFFNNLGVAAFVLKYRLARDDKSPFDKYDLEKHPLQDGHRAIRLVRSRASEWKIDPNRVGMMGFSAGGEVLSKVAFNPGEGDANAADPIDRLNGKPNFGAWIYPGHLGIPEGAIPADSPNAFLCVATDDTSAARNVDQIYKKYREARLPVEAHIFPKGGHAFLLGTRTELESIKHWPGRLVDWMTDNYVFDPAKKEADERRQREARERQQQRQQQQQKN